MPSLALSNGFLSSRSSVCPLQVHHARPPPSSNHRRSGTISCASSKEEETNIVMDRRGVLLGLGGLYGSAAKMAAGAPIAPPPDFKTWRKATSPGAPDQDHASLAVRDYPFPKTPLRVRRAAQNVDKAYVDKINEAVSRMKNLPANDPWNFYQQDKVNLNVHGSRLFLPWNRIYLHFYERILGKLIGDDTFALPFWNWDAPGGMTFPQIFFRDPNSVLYNANANADRNPTITPIAIIESDGPTWQELSGANVEQIRIAFRESLNNATLFMGEDAEGAGILENIHNAVQLGVETRYPDLGNFVSNGRDHIFYILHANVDRLWDAYGNILGGSALLNDSDSLESAFIFYDEFRQPTRVKVRDSLSSSNFGYTYETVPLPWLGKASRRAKAAAAPKAPTNLLTVSEFGPVPRDLDSTIRILVPRPKMNRSNEEKEEELEVLTTTGIQVNTPGSARFDVFIAKPYNGNQAGPDLGQYVGAFVKLAHYTPQEGPNGPGRKQGLKLGITYTIEDIGADDASSLVVSFKPRDGKVTIGGVEIKLIETDIKL